MNILFFPLEEIRKFKNNRLNNVVLQIALITMKRVILILHFIVIIVIKIVILIVKLK